MASSTTLARMTALRPTRLSLPALRQRQPAIIARRSLASSAPPPRPSLRLGSVAPNFRAQTTQGDIDFHQWLGDKWGILFSHPADFTPVCTTELGAFARMKGEFEKRGVKMIGLVGSYPSILSDVWLGG